MLALEIRARLYDLDDRDAGGLYDVQDTLVLVGLEDGLDFDSLIGIRLVGLQADLRRKIVAEQATMVALKKAGES